MRKWASLSGVAAQRYDTAVGPVYWCCGESASAATSAAPAFTLSALKGVENPPVSQVTCLERNRNLAGIEARVGRDVDAVAPVCARLRPDGGMCNVTEHL